MPSAHRMGLFALELALLVLLSPTRAGARTWHVAPDLPVDAPTIQAAIESCGTGDTVLVAASTYFENINFLGKSICLRSASGPEATVINGNNQAESTVRFVTGETNACIMEGFTITGGRGHLFESVTFGGGVYIDNSSPRMRNNIIRNNQAQYGGGVNITGSPSIDPALLSPHLDGNTISDNVASYDGGGLRIDFGNAVITNNRFLVNDASARGGGIYLRAWGSPTISRNQFRHNTAQAGGGLFAGFIGQKTVNFNLFVGNVARATGGGAHFESSSNLIVNNTFARNTAGPSTSSCTGGGLYLKNFYDTSVTRNIVAENIGCGIVCDNAYSTSDYQNNLVWENKNGDFVGCDSPPNAWVIADPRFCGANAGDFTVPSTSPAFGPGGPIGAHTEPGCTLVPVRETTWGSLKSKAWRP